MTINQSLAHGLEILFLYNHSTLELTVAEMSKRLGYSQSKTYRMVRTLIKYGMLQENLGTAQYSLSLNTLRLGLFAQRNFEISSIARPLMKELSLITKETILLTVINGTQRIVLDRVESEEPVRFSSFLPGSSIPLHCGASSKILMAFLPEKEWDYIITKEGLRQYTPKTIKDRNQLKTHLREIRKRGYAISEGEFNVGVKAVAAPIFNGLGEVVAGLGIVGPAFRINKNEMLSFAKLAIQYAKKISLKLS